jgi:hypothetical protein
VRCAEHGQYRRLPSSTQLCEQRPPKLTVLPLDLSDGDGEPVENAHEWLLMLLLLGTLQQ